MILHDELAKLYVEGGDLTPFREAWYFAYSDLSLEYEKTSSPSLLRTRRPGRRRDRPMSPFCQ